MAQADLVAGDSGSKVRVVLRDAATQQLVDLTGKTIMLRYSLNGAATQEKTMTALDQVSAKGEAEYHLSALDLSAAGELKGEVRLQDGLPDQLTTVDTFHLTIKAPLP